jgi:hypothetical protein
VRVKLLAHVWLVMTSPTSVTLTVPPQLSLVMTLAGLAAGTRFAHDTVIAPGQVIVGAVGSITVIACVQVAVLPQASVA